jgi:4-carboxymuconolactone decarboxylase
MLARRGSIMRCTAICAVLISAAALGQGTPPPDLEALGLAGGRFAPLTWEQMTAEQRTLIEHVLAGPRDSLGGPFNVLLRSPQMGDRLQEFGATMRFLDSIPAKLRELAIIITARHWVSEYEWRAHSRAAAQAGLDGSIIDAIRAGRRPESPAPDEAAVYDFATELLTTHAVSDATFEAALRVLGERGVVDCLALMGYYQTIAMMLNVDRHPLPDGAKPELAPSP